MYRVFYIIDSSSTAWDINFHIGYGPQVYIYWDSLKEIFTSADVCFQWITSTMQHILRYLLGMESLW